MSKLSIIESNRKIVLVMEIDSFMENTFMQGTEKVH